MSDSLRDVGGFLSHALEQEVNARARRKTFGCMIPLMWVVGGLMIGLYAQHQNQLTLARANAACQLELANEREARERAEARAAQLASGNLDVAPAATMKEMGMVFALGIVVTASGAIPISLFSRAVRKR